MTAASDRGRVALTVARFVLKHLAFLLLTLLVVSFLVFTLNEFSPGDVARKILGAYATQEQVEMLTVQMGLDRPVLVQLLLEDRTVEPNVLVAIAQERREVRAEQIGRASCRERVFEAV